MPEDYLSEYSLDEGPLTYLEQVYDVPTVENTAAPAGEPDWSQMTDWDFGAFQKQFMQGDPAKTAAANQWIADQAAQGKEYVYDPSQRDLAYQMAINSAVPLTFGGPSYANFDPNNPAASMGQVFRFDIDKNEATAPVVLSDGKNYVLTDAKGENVLGTASTPEQMQALIEQANAQKYGWNVYEGDQSGNYTAGSQLFGEADPRVGGVMGALVNYGLPIGVGLLTAGIGSLPSLGWGASAGLMGATGLTSGVLGGKSIEDALIQAAIAGGTAGLLKAPILEGGGTVGGFLGEQIGKIPVVGDALRDVGGALDLGGKVPAGVASDLIDDAIVVTARSAAPLVTSGLSSLASSFVPQVTTNPFTGEMSVGRQTPSEVSQEPAGLDAIAPDEIVVTAPTDVMPDLLGGLSSLTNNVVPQIVVDPLTGEASVQQPEPRAEEPRLEETNPDEIVVTAPTDVMPDTLGGLASLVNTAAPIVNQSPYTAPAETTQTTEQTDEPAATVIGERPLDIPPVGFAPPGSFQADFDQTFGPKEIVAEGRLDETDISTLPGLSTLAPDTSTITDPATLEPADDSIVVEAPKQPPLSIEDLVTIPGLSTLAPDTSTITDPATVEPAAQEDAIVVEAPKQPPLSISDISLTPDLSLNKLDTSTITDPATLEPDTETKTLDTMDKIRLGLIAAGLVSDVAGGGSGSQTKLPFGFGARNPIYSAKLPTPGQNGAFAVGGLGGSTLPVPPGGDYTQFGMGSATRATPTQIPQYGGVNPPGFNTQTWDWLGPQTGVAKDIMDQLAVLPSSAAPAEEPVKKAMGGYAVGGPGDGRSDEIPALLSDGEYVIDAETVALLGNGSNKAGAKQLDKFRANIRKHKGQQLAKGKFSVKAKQPSAYLSGGR